MSTLGFAVICTLLAAAAFCIGLFIGMCITLGYIDAIDSMAKKDSKTLKTPLT